MRWPGACVSAAKEACQSDLAPPDPRLTPAPRRGTPERAAADAGPALAAGSGPVAANAGTARSGAATNGERAEHRRPVRCARERRHEHVDASEVSHHDLTHAPLTTTSAT